MTTARRGEPRDAPEAGRASTRAAPRPRTGVSRADEVQRGRRAVAPGYGASYTSGMKTAVSLPDRLFRAAELHARRARKSRSQLYAEALAEYLARHAPDEVTEAMNRVVDQLDAHEDGFAASAARHTLARVEW